MMVLFVPSYKHVLMSILRIFLPQFYAVFARNDLAHVKVNIYVHVVFNISVLCIYQCNARLPQIQAGVGAGWDLHS